MDTLPRTCAPTAAPSPALTAITAAGARLGRDLEPERAQRLHACGLPVSYDRPVRALAAAVTERRDALWPHGTLARAAARHLSEDALATWFGYVAEQAVLDGAPFSAVVAWLDAGCSGPSWTEVLGTAHRVLHGWTDIAHQWAGVPSSTAAVATALGLTPDLATGFSEADLRAEAVRRGHRFVFALPVPLPCFPARGVPSNAATPAPGRPGAGAAGGLLSA